jgi:hypothetical protein
MARLTAQEQVLNAGRKEFGGSFLTEDHINYKRVGCKKNGKLVLAIGDTWDQAVASLRGKVA